MRRAALSALFLLGWSGSAAAVGDLTQGQAFSLSRHNVEAPFPYVHGGIRRWPITEAELPVGSTVRLSAIRNGQTLAEGPQLAFAGLKVSLSRQGMLEVASDSTAPAADFQLAITVSCPDQEPVSQTLEVRPAPPPRPISYISDFSSELSRIFESDDDGTNLRVERGAIDQYFRRLQAQGISRLIVWLSPFPFINDPNNYAPADWERYERQARAILKSDALSRVIRQNRSSSWNWIRRCLALRLRSDFGQLLSESARQHEISLTVSFRPLEAAVSTYWEVPAFDESGKFLWGFLPFAAPDINYHPQRVGFAHYRTILDQMGKAEDGKLERIVLTGAKNSEPFLQRFRTRGDNLRITASHIPPFQEDSLVLQQDAGGEFRLVPFEAIQKDVRSHDHVVQGFQIAADASGELVISGLSVPDHYRYLLITNPADAPEALELTTRRPVTLQAVNGHRLGRANVFWVLNDTPEIRRRTRHAGVPSDGQWHQGREVTRASWEALRDAPPTLALRGRTLVIDRGAPWSVELLDLEQDAARQRVVAEIRTVLAYPAFDEIFINTRSHTDLAGSTHFAYAPRSVATQPALRSAASDPASIEKITVGPDREWQGSCQSPACSSPWRYSLNRAMASGTRRLLDDLAREFPGTRTRMVMLPREQAVTAIRDALETMPRPDGGVYGRDYYWSIVPGWNHHSILGEATAMVDLTGLAVEPVFLGIHTVPDPAPLALYLRECLKDMKDNHGSRFDGPRSFFYEAHPTLQGNDPAARRRREEIICQLLAHRDDIGEVILYEAAVWTYRLDLTDPDLCGHGFVDRCDQILNNAE